MGSEFRIGGISWEQERKRVLVDIFSQLVQGVFEVGGDVNTSLFEGAQDGLWATKKTAPKMTMLDSLLIPT